MLFYYSCQEMQQQLLARLESFDKALRFYDREGRQLARSIITSSEKAYQAGEIDFLQYILSLENAKNIDKNYLDNLIQYNWTALEINYLTN